MAAPSDQSSGAPWGCDGTTFQEQMEQRWEQDIKIRLISKLDVPHQARLQIFVQI